MSISGPARRRPAVGPRARGSTSLAPAGVAALAAVAVFAAVLVLCAGCGQGEEGNVVRFLEGPDAGGGWKEILARFHAAHPGIRVEMVEGPAATNTREDLYAVDFLSGEATYDVISMDVIWVPKFAAQGWLRPLDDHFPASARAAFLPGDIQGSTWLGKIYRVPMRADAGVLYYRTDLVPTPPETFDDLVAAARRTQKPPERWGLVFQGRQYEGLVCNFLEVLWGNGGDVLDAKGEVVLDRPAGLRALEWMVRLVRDVAPEGVTTYQEEEARHAFQEGRAVFLRNWPYAWTKVQEAGSPVRGQVGICPMVHAPGCASAATLGGWGLGIAAKARHPEAAWTFVEFATQAEQQAILHRKNGVLARALRGRGAGPSEPPLPAAPPGPPGGAPAPGPSGLRADLGLALGPRQLRAGRTGDAGGGAPARGRRDPFRGAPMKRYLYVLPAAVLLGAVLGLPLTFGLARGTGQFARTLTDPTLGRVALTTLAFGFVSVALELALGLVFALALHESFRLRGAARAVALLPWALPTAVMAMSWRWIFNDNYGVANDLLLRLGLLDRGIAWLGRPGTAFAALVLADVWKTTPFVMILVLAGLQSIPADLYEAAAVDGAVRAVSFEVREGETLTLLGPSGCGKSTLLRLVAGLERPDAGEVRIGGACVNALEPGARDVAMVFQSYALYPHLTAFDNVAVALRLRRLPEAEVRRRVEAAAARLGMGELLGRRPRELSGGQRQRVALARALVREPKVFLLDEPLSNLDAQLREHARAELKALFRQLRATVIYVTHDQVEAMTLSDRVAVLNAGGLEQVGAPEELYDRPATLFVAGFVGSPRMNLVAGELLGETAATAGVRPEDVVLALDGPQAMTVTLREALGAQHLLTLRSGPLELRALVAAGRAAQEAVRVRIDPTRVHRFDASGRRLAAREGAPGEPR